MCTCLRSSKAIQETLIKFTFLDICKVDISALCRVIVGDIALKQFFKLPLFKHSSNVNSCDIEYA